MDYGLTTLGVFMTIMDNRQLKLQFMGEEEDPRTRYAFIYFALTVLLINSLHVTHSLRLIQLFQIELDYPNEYIISFSGYVGDRNGLLLVMSLSFRTNYKKIHGPFGREVGMPFSFASNIGKIVGFHGQSGQYVDSIGVHVEILAS